MMKNIYRVLKNFSNYIQMVKVQRSLEKIFKYGDLKVYGIDMDKNGDNIFSLSYKFKGDKGISHTMVMCGLIYNKKNFITKIYSWFNRYRIMVDNVKIDNMVVWTKENGFDSDLFYILMEDNHIMENCESN